MGLSYKEIPMHMVALVNHSLLGIHKNQLNANLDTFFSILSLNASNDVIMASRILPQQKSAKKSR